MTGLFRRILIPTDFSGFGDVAMRYGLLFNKQLGSHLTVFHADSALHLTMLAGRPRRHFFEEPTGIAAGLRQRLEEQAGRNGLSGETGVRIATGHPATEILRAANGADLVIMGTHGLSGWKRAILGSVTMEVLRKAGIPVLAAALPPENTTLREGLRSILCVVSGTATSRYALSLASRIATEFGAALWAVQIVEPAATSVDVLDYDELRTWLTPEMRVGNRFREMVVHGDIAERAAGLAELRHSELVVLSSRPQNAWNVLLAAPCAVLTVPAEVNEKSRTESAEVFYAGP